MQMSFSSGTVAFLLAVLWFISFQTSGQDVIFSQFHGNLMYHNPAFAGSADYNRLSINYRNHWPELHSDFITYNASYDQPVELLHGGIGIHLFNDNLGDGTLRIFSAALIYTYHLRVTREFFVFAGFQASINQNRLASGNLVFEDMIDPFRGVVFQTGENISGYQKLYPDFAVGFLGIYKELYGGITIHHLAKPGISENPVDESRLSRKYTVHVANNFYLKGTPNRAGAIVLTPTLLFQQQDHYQNLHYGFVLAREPVSIGVWLRHDFAFSGTSAIFGAAVNYKNISIGYSYDMAIIGAGPGLPGTAAHEITCIAGFSFGKKRSVIKAIKVPKI